MKILNSRFKLTRRENINLELFIKRKKIPRKKKNFKKKRFLRISEYRKKIREFKKIKIKYCLNNGNFNNIIKNIKKKKKNLFLNFVKKLETRLDNIVYRIGFSGTRREARQFIIHKHVCVNGIKVYKPSYEIKKNDIIEVNNLVFLNYKNQIKRFSYIINNKCKIKSLGFYKKYCNFFNSFYTLSILNK
ncbi:30S ribosomal protein S4 [Candidatus Vidania fulgoroideorum]